MVLSDDDTVKRELYGESGRLWSNIVPSGLYSAEPHCECQSDPTTSLQKDDIKISRYSILIIL